jgi:methylmalonyl-CoA/ethylmalonyl-CoA epimerase
MSDTINHVAYRVSDLASEADRLGAQGFLALSEPTPAVAYGGQHIQFLINGDSFLIELIEAPVHEHRYFETDQVVRLDVAGSDR